MAADKFHNRHSFTVGIVVHTWADLTIQACSFAEAADLAKELTYKSVMKAIPNDYKLHVLQILDDEVVMP